MDGITESMVMSLSKLQEIVEAEKPGVLQSMGSQSQTRLLSGWGAVSSFTLFKALGA